MWEMWLIPHSEKPVGSKFGRQDPCPWIGSPVGKGERKEKGKEGKGNRKGKEGRKKE